LQSLETLVTQLLPGVSVDDLLSSPDAVRNISLSIAGASESSHVPSVSSPQGSSKSTTNEPGLPEAVPNSADGFNWQEENVALDNLTDGMAALSVEPTGVGYLGQYVHTLYRSVC
jgi:transcriptional regulatory protein GAL4